MKNIWLLLLTAAAAAMLFGFITSPHHLGLTEDCLRYLSMAKHAAAWKGFSVYNPSIGPVSLPYISQAPLWSAMIAPGLMAGLTPESWTWLCIVVLFGLNIFAVGLTALYGSKHVTAALAAQFIILCDPHFLTNHGYTLSEPLFFILVQVAVLTLWIYLDSGRARWLAAAIAAVGLIGLTRYIGLTYAAGLTLSLILFERAKILRRVSAGILWGALGALPLGLWFIRHFLLRHEWFGMHVAESQTHHFFPAQVTADFLTQTLRYPVTNGWLKDRPESIWIFPALTLLGIIFFIHRGQTERKDHGPLLLILFPAVYSIGMIGVWTARSVQSYQDPWRLSAPIFLHLWVFLVIFISRAVGEHTTSSERSKPRMILCRAALVLLLFWGVGLVPKTYAWMSRAVTTGEYGRDDSIPWAAANRIMWFPPS